MGNLDLKRSVLTFISAAIFSDIIFTKHIHYIKLKIFLNVRLVIKVSQPKIKCDINIPGPEIT